MADADARRELARRFVEEVLTLENLDAVEEIFAPPGEWRHERTVPGYGRIESYADLEGFYREEVGKIEDRAVTVRSVVVDGAEAVAWWTAEGRVDEEFFDIPATAQAHETTGFSYFAFEEGRVVEQFDHVNMLDLLPDVAQAARRGVLREMRDGVVVLDEDGRIVDLNAAVLDVFDRDRDDLLGDPVAVLLGDASTPAPGESTEVTGPDGRRYFEVVASPLTDDRGDPLGRTLAFHEITERRRHVQGLDVLTRVLRHNLRNDLTAVRGRIELASDRADDDVAELLADALETTDRLLGTAETARDVQAALADTGVCRQDVGEMVTRLGERARETYPAATVETTRVGATVAATTALEAALWELVQNACEHAGDAPRVTVTVSREGDEALVTVADDGPGLPAHEREVLSAGEETPLDHGSGLGLWLAQWVVDASGGELAFDVGDGTTVRATLPLADGSTGTA